MRSTFALAVVASFIGQALAAPTINTPSSLQQCAPSLLSWSGTSGAVQLFITAGSDPTGAALHDLGSQDGTSFTYVVTDPANTQLVFNIRDSTGAIYQTAIVTVGSGGSDSCLNSSSSAGSSTGSSSSSGTAASDSSSSAAATTTTSSASTPAATTSAASTTSTVTTPATTSTRTTGTSSATTTSSGSASSGSSAAASSTSTGNSAGATQYSMGVAGVVGAAVIAMLA